MKFLADIIFSNNIRVVCYYGFVLFIIISQNICADGELDPTFGSGGTVTTVFVGTSRANDLALQADGKIVAAGQVLIGADDNFALARYNTNGSLDTTFGTGGLVTTSFGVGNDAVANAVAVQTDGKILAVGSVTIGITPRFALARYNTNGSLDTTFGTGGQVTTSFLSGAELLSVVMQPDNKIVVGGYAIVGATLIDFAVARYNTNGSLDTTFGTGGVTVTPFSGTSQDRIFSIALQTDGKIVASGTSDVSGTFDFALARYNTNGSLDTTFGTSGLVITGFGIGVIANGVLVLPSGKILAGGSDGANYYLAQYTTAGLLDSAFGTFGTVTGTGFSINAIALQSSGRIVSGGRTGTDFGIARFKSNGSLDPSFGSGGLVSTNFGGTDEAFGVVIQPDGKIVAAGRAGNNFGLARYLSTECLALIGSDTILNVFNTEQFVALNGRIAKLALLQGGFTLCNNATFASCFPVVGDICLGCYTLTLENDLFMNNLSYIASVGSIIGNGHWLDLSESITVIPNLTCNIVAESFSACPA